MTDFSFSARGLLGLRPLANAASAAIPILRPGPLTLLLVGLGVPGVPGSLAAQSAEAHPAGSGAVDPSRVPLPPPELLRVLPATSTPRVDGMLAALEEAYSSMDVERFVALFAEDFEQVDVNRRVRVAGRDAWRAQTERINGAHVSMGRVHHGRALVGDWVVVELEWSGTVRGDAIGRPGEPASYRYDGLGLIELDGEGLIRRQIFYGDVITLEAQLGAPVTPR